MLETISLATMDASSQYVEWTKTKEQRRSAYIFLIKQVKNDQ